MLTHENLDAYNVSIEFAGLAYQLCQELPKTYGAVSDQLRWAATSVPANIAQACGRAGPHEFARHMALARGSAAECGALLDVVNATLPAPHGRHNEGKLLLVRVVSMLTRLCVSTRPAPAPSRPG